MTRSRSTLAILLITALAGDASAQFFPVIGLPTIGQGGIAFKLGGKRLRVEGFFPLGDPYPAILPVTPTPFGFKQVAPAYLPYGYYGYPYPPVAPGYPFPGYGVVEQRFTLQIINPPTVVVRGQRIGLRETPDLTGIDLDVESPDKIWGNKPGLAKGGPPRKIEIARDPPAEKKVQLAAAPAKPPPAPPPPKFEPIPDGQRFVDLGITAFKKGDYGVAILRFHQAAEADPPGPRATFLEAQALIVVGMYREAAQLIHTGLQGNPNWPTSLFRPKVELYDNRDDVWNEHRAALEAAHKLQPKNADYLFLLGYLEWFGGERDLAVVYFQRAQAQAMEARGSEVFLKVAAAKKN